MATRVILGAQPGGGGGDLVTSVAGRQGDVILDQDDVGLDDVDNTADADKPVSTAQQTALDLKANAAAPALTGTVTIGGDVNLYRSAADVLETDDSLVVGGGHVTLGSTAQLYNSGAVVYFRNASDSAYVSVDLLNATVRGILSSIGVVVLGPYALGTSTAITVSVTGDAQNRLVITADGTLLWGDGTAAGDANLYRSAADTLKTDDNLVVGGTLAVTGAVTGVTKTAVGLGNVDNTSDAAKPVSTATQAALDLKANAASPALTGTVTLGGDVTLYRSAADTLTTDDAVTIVTALTSSYPLKVTNTDGSGGGIAVYLASAVRTVLRAAQSGETVPRFYLTGNGELNWGDGTNPVDSNFYRSATGTLKTDGALIVVGTLTAPTAAPGTNTTQVATTAFVTAAVAAAPSGGSFVSSAKWGTD